MFTYLGIWYFFERGLPEGWAPAAEPGPKATLFHWAGSLGSGSLVLLNVRKEQAASFGS